MASKANTTTGVVYLISPLNIASITLGDGTAAAPSLAFASDTDSGLYRIGANNIGVGVNGANVLNVSTTGLVVTGTAQASAIGIGASVASNHGLDVAPSFAVTNAGISTYPTLTATANGVLGIESQVRTSAAAITLTNAYDFYANDAQKGAGSTITDQYAFYVAALTAGTNNYPFYANTTGVATRLTQAGELTVGTRLGIGTAADVTAGIKMSGLTLSGSSSQYLGYFDGTFGASATNFGAAVYAQPRTANSSFTMSKLYGFYAGNGAKGAANTITTQYGLYIEGMTVGTTNYAIYTNDGIVHLNNFDIYTATASTLDLRAVGGADTAIVKANQVQTTGAITIGNTVDAGVGVASTHKVTMVIGGTTYYLLASNV